MSEATLANTIYFFSRARLFNKQASADLCMDKLMKHDPNDWPAEEVDRLTKEDLLLLVRVSALFRIARWLTSLRVCRAHKFKRYARDKRAAS